MSRAIAMAGGAYVIPRGAAVAWVNTAGKIDGCNETPPLKRNGAGPIGRDACESSPQQHGPISAVDAQP